MNLAFDQDPHFDAVEEADDEEGGDDDHDVIMIIMMIMMTMMIMVMLPRDVGAQHHHHHHHHVAKECGHRQSAQASDSGGEQLGAAVSWHPKALQGRRRPTPPSDAFDRDSCTS